MPLLFFAGPVLGGGDWQSRAANIAEKLIGDNVCVIIPRLYPADHRLSLLQAPESPAHVGAPELAKKFPWERWHQPEAALFHPWGGAIMFWFECESKTEPRTDGLPYAMSSREEVGEWRGHMMYDERIRCVVGADPKFPGRNQMLERFNDAFHRSFKIHNTLGKTVEAAAKTMLRGCAFEQKDSPFR